MIRETARELVEKVAPKLPLSACIHAATAGPLVLYYHLISDKSVAHVNPLYRYRTVREFETDLDYLLRNFVPLETSELLEWLEGTRDLRPNSFYLTFDDGLREMAEIVAPLLSRRGLAATFFVNSGFLDNKALFYRFKASLLLRKMSEAGDSAALKVRERFRVYGVQCVTPQAAILSLKYSDESLFSELAEMLNVDFQEYLKIQRPFMTSDDVRWLLKTGFDIGSHGINHLHYANLTLKEQLAETVPDYVSLREKFKVRDTLFAFPFDATGVSREFFEKLRSDGVRATFGTGGWFHDVQLRLINRVSPEGDKPRLPASLRQSLYLDTLRHTFPFVRGR